MNALKYKNLAIVVMVLVGGGATWGYLRSQHKANEIAHAGEHRDHELNTQAHGQKVVTYRGENYTLPLQETDYSAEQAAKIERIIMSDVAPSRFQTYQAMMDYVNTLEVPGYGSSTGGYGDQTPLGQITYISIQLPKKSEFRVITYRAGKPNAEYVYVDDFLIKYPYPPAFEFTAEGDELVYKDEKNKNVLRKISLQSRMAKE